MGPGESAVLLSSLWRMFRNDYDTQASQTSEDLTLTTPVRPITWGIPFPSRYRMVQPPST
jgi:hypothetical protein